MRKENEAIDGDDSTGTSYGRNHWFCPYAWNPCGEEIVSAIQIASSFFGLLSVYVLTSLLFPERFE